MNAWARWPLLALATFGAAGLASGAADADEHYSGETTIGSRFALVNTGQIDDPLEDVLEHAAIFGSSTYTYD
ncbi:hypothetical protein [Streptomyces sp. MP131-18]|uniref:hypothetical protein n=1 Tax=Streptomyces sp. MP131-18 TaxID=1857892 RepID=UPI0009CDF592|nr:hypothetical protein [Streptomyces sp. MP131-18]ONK15844.1 hypothetical protein STBA_66850 [Streptomyces sp. MP131-18]